MNVTQDLLYYHAFNGSGGVNTTGMDEETKRGAIQVGREGGKEGGREGSWIRRIYTAVPLPSSHC